MRGQTFAVRNPGWREPVRAESEETDMSVTGEIEWSELNAWLGDAKAQMSEAQYDEFCQRAREAGPDGDWSAVLKSILGE